MLIEVNMFISITASIILSKQKYTPIAITTLFNFKGTPITTDKLAFAEQILFRPGVNLDSRKQLGSWTKFLNLSASANQFNCLILSREVKLTYMYFHLYNLVYVIADVICGVGMKYIWCNRCTTTTAPTPPHPPPPPPPPPPQKKKKKKRRKSNADFAPSTCYA